MVAAKTGHSTSSLTNIRSYLDRMNPLHGLPAALALHGLPINAKVVLPKLSAVGEANLESIHRLVSAMFSISIPDFQDGGRLRNVTEQFAASLIMHHNDALQDCGQSNKVPSELIERALKANVSYAGKPGLTAAEIVMQYSLDIKQQFKADLLASKVAARGEREDSLDLTMLSKIMEDIGEIKTQNKDMATDLAATKQTLAHESEQKERYQKELEQVRIQLAETQQELAEANAALERYRERFAAYDMIHHRSPVEKCERVPKRKRIEGGTTKLNLQESVDTEITQPLEEPSTLPPKTLSIPNPEPLDVQSTTPSTVPDPNNLKPSAVAQLRNNNKSDAVNSSQGDRGLTLSSALEDLAVAGLLKSLDKFGNIASVPETIISKVNVSKLRACLDLIDFAGNPFDMEILRDGKKAVGSSVQDAASRLTSTVLDKMFELEGTTAEIAQAGGNVPGEAVMGLSKRISRYRDNIKTATGQEHVKTGKIALMEYTDYLAAKREAQRVKDGLAPGQEGPIMQWKRGGSIGQIRK
jgi:hypothetical protein